MTIQTIIRKIAERAVYQRILSMREARMHAGIDIDVARSIIVTAHFYSSMLNGCTLYTEHHGGVSCRELCLEVDKAKPLTVRRVGGNYYLDSMFFEDVVPPVLLVNNVFVEVCGKRQTGLDDIPEYEKRCGEPSVFSLYCGLYVPELNVILVSKPLVKKGCDLFETIVHEAIHWMQHRGVILEDSSGAKFVPAVRVCGELSYDVFKSYWDNPYELEAYRRTRELKAFSCLSNLEVATHHLLD